MKKNIVGHKLLETNKSSLQPNPKMAVSKFTSCKNFSDQHINITEKAVLEAERKKATAINMINRCTFR